MIESMRNFKKNALKSKVNLQPRKSGNGRKKDEMLIEWPKVDSWWNVDWMTKGWRKIGQIDRYESEEVVRFVWLRLVLS